MARHPNSNTVQTVQKPAIVPKTVLPTDPVRAPAVPFNPEPDEPEPVMPDLVSTPVVIESSEGKAERKAFEQDGKHMFVTTCNVMMDDENGGPKCYLPGDHVRLYDGQAKSLVEQGALELVR